MQVLNIDAYASPKRELQLGGVSYPVKEIDLQSFIDNLDAAERLAAAGAAGIKEQIKVSVDLVCENIPTLPRELAERFNVEQLAKVLEFIRGELDTSATSAAPAAEGEKKVS